MTSRSHVPRRWPGIWGPCWCSTCSSGRTARWGHYAGSRTWDGTGTRCTASRAPLLPRYAFVLLCIGADGCGLRPAIALGVLGPVRGCGEGMADSGTDCRSQVEPTPSAAFRSLKSQQSSGRPQPGSSMATHSLVKSTSTVLTAGAGRSGAAGQAQQHPAPASRGLAHFSGQRAQAEQCCCLALCEAACRLPHCPRGWGDPGGHLLSAWLGLG